MTILIWITVHTWGQPTAPYKAFLSRMAASQAGGLHSQEQCEQLPFEP
jgi:hypothetical protein